MHLAAASNSVDFNQTDHLQSTHLNSGRLLTYDTENPSTSTSATIRTSRSINANDRGADLPPVKVTMVVCVINFKNEFCFNFFR